MRPLASNSLDKTGCHPSNRNCLPVAHRSSPRSLIPQWAKREFKTMAKRGNGLPLRESAGTAIAGYCYARHPRHTAKNVANEIGCEVRTSKGWLAGNLPSSGHLLTMMERWGLDFLVCLLEPVDASIAREIRLKAQIEKLTQDLEHLKEEMNNTEG